MINRIFVEAWTNLQYRFWIFLFMAIYFTSCHAGEIISATSSFFWIGFVVPAFLFGITIYTLTQYLNKENQSTS